MNSKIRTQVLLERRQYERLKELAFKRGNSFSGVLREVLDQALEMKPAESRAVREALLKFVGSGRDAERDVAREHDRYLYGDGDRA